MSDGITLLSPCCRNSTCLKKEYDEYKYTHKSGFNTAMDVYTCDKCKATWAIERMVRDTCNKN